MRCCLPAVNLLTDAQTAPTGVRRIGAVNATTAAPAADVSVAVLDTGVDLSHPDLNVVAGTNCIIPGTPPQDVDGHGTHCSGSIAAKNNAGGVIGVAPGTQIVAVKVGKQATLGTCWDATECECHCQTLLCPAGC
jgi:subtilisin